MAEQVELSESPAGTGEENTTTSSGQDANDELADRIDAAVDRILEAFEEKLKYDQSKQQVIDRLHDELRGHRADLVAQAAGPFIFGMIRHHGEIGKLLSAVRDGPAGDVPSAKVCELLESLQEDVEDVLRENGIAAYRAEVSDPFDPVRQTVAGKVVPTSDEQRSGTIAACLGPGFERAGKILVKARVSAYRFESPSPAPPRSESETEPDAT